MDKIEKLVEIFEERVKSIADSVENKDRDTLLEVSEELNTILSKIVDELNKD
ncbi:MAG: hypothetical protein ACOX1R_01720 [Caldicoprobacterales bacterium]|jgi:hypothetical protein|nr:hypothetical protein [Clostridiales bacterium]